MCFDMQNPYPGFPAYVPPKMKSDAKMALPALSFHIWLFFVRLDIGELPSYEA